VRLLAVVERKVNDRPLSSKHTLPARENNSHLSLDRPCLQPGTILPCRNVIHRWISP